MKILVLGGTLFIGYHVVKQLAQEGKHKIVLFNRGNRKDDIPEGVDLIIGDKNNLRSYKSEFKKFAPDVVLYMVPFGAEDSEMVMEVFRGIAKRIVGISSEDVYRAYGKLIGLEKGELEALPLTENSPLRTELYPYRDMEGMPERLRNYDKILAEENILSEPDLPGTILRLPMVYGPRDYQHRLLPIVKRIEDNRPAIIIKQSTAIWRTSRGYVEDIAHAICLAIKNDKAANRIYNVAQEKHYTEYEWAQQIAKVMNWHGQIVIVPDDKPDPYFFPEYELVLDSSRIRNELDYKEITPFEVGLKRTIEWEKQYPKDKIDPKMFDYKKEDKILRDYI